VGLRGLSREKGGGKDTPEDTAFTAFDIGDSVAKSRNSFRAGDFSSTSIPSMATKEVNNISGTRPFRIWRVGAYQTPTLLQRGDP